MSTRKKETSQEKQEEKSKNIEGLEELRVEYLKNKMPDRKVLALRNKLISLHLENVITEREKELMILILYRERKNGTISNAHVELLNRIEIDDVDGECVVSRDDAPHFLYLTKDLVCKYKHLPLDNRFIVFVPRKIRSDFQYSMELAQKLERKLPVDESEYPKERELIHRLDLSEVEFNAWFITVEDELKPKVDREEVYQF